jgi:hypothetical protein
LAEWLRFLWRLGPPQTEPDESGVVLRDLPDDAHAVLERQRRSGQRPGRSWPLVQFKQRVGRRLRLIFYVSEIDLYLDSAWVHTSGWYIHTLEPSPDWMINEPAGPYESLAELKEDTFALFREQDREEFSVERQRVSEWRKLKRDAERAAKVPESPRVDRF